jgi:SprT-like family
MELAMAKRGRPRKSYERKAEAITPIEYSGLQAAYDHFNAVLFDGALVDVFITYQRHAHSRGHFSADRFAGRTAVGGKHELALNPDAFVGRSDEEITSTLVHEMVHVWQQQHGKAAARGYHNKQWAAKMKEIGLQPSNTGAVGGKETGQQMSHYIIRGGRFLSAFCGLAMRGWKLNLESAHRPGPDGGRKSKTKFTCSNCGQNVWGKPNAQVTCTPCGIEMHSIVPTNEKITRDSDANTLHA